MRLDDVLRRDLEKFFFDFLLSKVGVEVEFFFLSSKFECPSLPPDFHSTKRLTSSTGTKMSTQMFPSATASKRFSLEEAVPLPLLPEVEVAAAAALVVVAVVVCRWVLRRRARVEHRAPASHGARMRLNCCKEIVTFLLDLCAKAQVLELRGDETAGRQGAQSRLTVERLMLDIILL